MLFSIQSEPAVGLPWKIRNTRDKGLTDATKRLCKSIAEGIFTLLSVSLIVNVSRMIEFAQL
jgi:hypothetical protein